MKGIMFNEHYGLESATLNGIKTRTSRIVNFPKTRCGKDVCSYYVNRNNPFTKVDIELLDADGDSIEPSPTVVPLYKLNEVVAIKQAYNIALSIIDWCHRGLYKDEPGWNNKMFVRADLMPHHIKITNIDVQNLQDISYEDCLKEGIYKDWRLDEESKYSDEELPFFSWFSDEDVPTFETAQDAFASLIDKTCGKGTWDSNPLVWVYYYELLD